MAATYKGKNGKLYTVIEPAIGKGGEGSVYGITGMPDYVLKVFKDDKCTESRHRKLLTMITTTLSPSAMQQITWPIDVVYQNGQFVGYVMPAIKNNEDLNVMYSDKYICTLSEKITIAKNLCAAINAVHNAGQVCGDLNPKNIGVDPQSARVTLVDTDSYHITDTNVSRVYRCEVGLPEYLAREIQEKLKNNPGKNLATVSGNTFSKETDLFALAIHIFALLMNGCHPFACAIDNKVNIGPLSNNQPSVVKPEPIDNIISGYFPFYTQKAGFTTPRYAPEFDSLPQNIQTLFVRAFVNGHNTPTQRPDTVEWYNALTTMQQNLKVCTKNKKHMYPSHLKKCTWCELELKTLPIAPSTIVQTPVKTYTTTTQTSTHSNSNSYASSTPLKLDGIMASSGMFWFLTLAITLGAQAILHSVCGEELISGLFGSGYGDGIESWGMNIAIWFGPWGFVICGLIGTLIYNCCWSSGGQLYGYKWYHYVLSILTSFVCSALYILLILLISIAIVLAAVALGVALVCGLLSGS